MSRKRKSTPRPHRLDAGKLKDALRAELKRAGFEEERVERFVLGVGIAIGAHEHLTSLDDTTRQARLAKELAAVKKFLRDTAHPGPSDTTTHPVLATPHRPRVDEVLRRADEVLRRAGEAATQAAVAASVPAAAPAAPPPEVQGARLPSEKAVHPGPDPEDFYRARSISRAAVTEYKPQIEGWQAVAEPPKKARADATGLLARIADLFAERLEKEPTETPGKAFFNIVEFVIEYMTGKEPEAVSRQVSAALQAHRRSART